jgi:response regulator RpfG family c-di-GMP phosphodiesterase
MSARGDSLREDHLSVRPDELASVEMLAHLPRAALAELAEGAWRRAFHAGEVVFNEGDSGHSLHVVRSGALAVIRPSHDSSLVLERLEAGQAFGELAVLNSEPRLASVIAVEPSETVEVAKASLERVLDRNPQAMREMLGALARSLTLAKEEIARHNHSLRRTVQERTDELQETHLEVIRRLGQAAESRDDDTGLHITRMSQLCARLAGAAGMSEEQSEMLLHAAPMHDIGKIGIPDRILLKPGKLEPHEWEIMKSHTTIGATILAGSRSPVVQMAELIALTHHEKWDGSGYPSGLRGEEIPLVGRVCAVCDVFDALISERPYKRDWSVAAALAEIETQAGMHFDPRLARVFLEVYADQLGEIVERPTHPELSQDKGARRAGSALPDTALGGLRRQG